MNEKNIKQHEHVKYVDLIGPKNDDNIVLINREGLMELNKHFPGDEVKICMYVGEFLRGYYGETTNEGIIAEATGMSKVRVEKAIQNLKNEEYLVESSNSKFGYEIQIPINCI